MANAFPTMVLPGAVLAAISLFTCVANAQTPPASSAASKPAAKAPQISMTEDIASNPKRSSLAAVLSMIITVADRPGLGLIFNDYNLAVRSMKESARNGWVGDFFVGELAMRSIGRVQYKEENGQIVRDAKGSPIVEFDRVANLAGRITGNALNDNPPKTIDMGKGIEPIFLNKTRVCIAGFADANMRLKLLTGTQGQPDAVTEQAVTEVVADSRKQISDAALEDRVKDHLANKSANKKLSDVVDDCAHYGLRQLHDEGFRYQGQKMMKPPVKP
jgi:hypothetical protein